MRIAYHYPYPSTIYANRTVYHGFRNAFRDLGHDFFTATPDRNLFRLLEAEEIDLFMTSSHFLHRKYLDYKRLARLRARRLFVLTKIEFWRSPLATRLNEARSLKDDPEVVSLIRSRALGDAYYHVVEQDDARMDGFAEVTGQRFHTIPLAADKTLMTAAIRDARFEADISFIGTYLPEKRRYFDQAVLPLGNKHRLRLYGQDWTRLSRILGFIQRLGQYFNIPVVKSLQKPKLALEDEARIYASSTISINVHEAYQRRFGGDCNERTFKIPLFGGFEITDDVACIRRHFVAEKEIVIARDQREWFNKIEYYLRYPELRLPIIQAGRDRVLKAHTYHDRVNQILSIVQAGKA